MWGIIPAAGEGRRIQPLAFSKELLPVGAVPALSAHAPRAVSDFIVERMTAGGVDTISFIISPDKTDILRYHGAGCHHVRYVYHVQPMAAGLCDALFCPAPLIPKAETVLIGLPDTVWFPTDGYRALPDDRLSFLLFPVKSPSQFDAVNTRADGSVENVQVKDPHARNPWVWGAIKVPGAVYHALHDLWERRRRKDEYFGTLVNQWLAEGGTAVGVRAGTQYLDVGTIEGFHEACRLLRAQDPQPSFAVASPGEEAGAGVPRDGRRS